MNVLIKPGVRPSRLRRAFSLVEVMVAVTLMSVIVLGLLAMFSQTQRAFRAGITQVDVMESGRAALEMLARELEQTTPTGLPNSVNFYAHWNGYALVQSLPGTDGAGQLQWRTSVLQDIFFFTRENRNWQGVGYRVESTSYVGTLYRYETNVSNLNLDWVAAADDPSLSAVKFRDRVFATRRSRVIDGVVHFRVLAYDTSGYLITPYNRSPDPNYVVPFGPNNSIAVTNNMPAELSYEYHFRSNAVPAYVELEIGVLEQKTAERARNLPLASQPKFLESKAGNVQVFRQRIPIRNVDPSQYQ